MLHRAIPVLILATVSCGGATELNGDGGPGEATGGSGGTGGTGGNSSSNSGGPSSVSSSGGGHTSVATITSTTATTAASSTTGGHCPGFECGASPCYDGRYEVLPGDCCPTCVCSDVLCEPIDCPNGRIEDVAGYCCPQCVEALCEGVRCDPPSECGAGRSFTRPDGACCKGCIPDEPGGVLCPELACPPENICAKGFVPGDLVGGCCHECLPDPLYCERDEECVLADRPRACCGCPEVISTRTLADDPCWYSVTEPRMILPECYPDVLCDLLCGACADPGTAACIGNRCLEVVHQ